MLLLLQPRARIHAQTKFVKKNLQEESSRRIFKKNLRESSTALLWCGDPPITWGVSAAGEPMLKEPKKPTYNLSMTSNYRKNTATDLQSVLVDASHLYTAPSTVLTKDF